MKDEPLMMLAMSDMSVESADVLWCCKPLGALKALLLLLLYGAVEKQGTGSLADPSLSRDPLSSFTTDNGGSEGEPTSI